MKKLLIIIMILIILMICSLFSACSDSAVIPQPQSPYAEIFDDLLSQVTIGEQYTISVDLTNVLYNNPEQVKEDIGNYLVKQDITVLWDNMEKLIEKGYVDVHESGFPNYFEKGFLIVYDDISLTESKLNTKAYIWYGIQGAVGATYTVEKEDEKWEITSIDDWWIS